MVSSVKSRGNVRSFITNSLVITGPTIEYDDPLTTWNHTLSRMETLLFVLVIIWLR